MEINELKKHLQNHLSDGLVIIIGSGLSCAEGMPGMSQLANQIVQASQDYDVLSKDKKWPDIVNTINNNGLEAAFTAHQLSTDMEKSIMEITAKYLIDFEHEIIRDVLSDKKQLKFTKLLSHVLKPKTGIQVITTNYDRLIEIASEDAGLGVNTMFWGNYMGKLDQRESRFNHCRDVRTVGKQKAELIFRDHVCIYKPHGSFDWYQKGTVPIRHSGNLPLPRLIITPGTNKFRSGYESPFDKHREEANRVIDKASRFLIIGYGFNDDHLETHLKPAIQSGKSTVLLTQKISDKAKIIINQSPTFIALEQASNGTHLLGNKVDGVFQGIDLWDLSKFIDEVF